MKLCPAAASFFCPLMARTRWIVARLSWEDGEWGAWAMGRGWGAAEDRAPVFAGISGAHFRGDWETMTHYV